VIIRLKTARILYMTQRYSVFKCRAVLPPSIFSCKDGLKPQKYCRISRLKTFLQGKRPRQNRIYRGGTPPKTVHAKMEVLPTPQSTAPARGGGCFDEPSLPWSDGSLA